LCYMSFLLFFPDGQDDDSDGNHVRRLLAPHAYDPADTRCPRVCLRLRVLPVCLDLSPLAFHVIRLLQPYSLLLDEQKIPCRFQKYFLLL
jgi:hypothetical protein